MSERPVKCPRCGSKGKPLKVELQYLNGEKAYCEPCYDPFHSQPDASPTDEELKQICKCGHAFGAHSAGLDSRCMSHNCNCNSFVERGDAPTPERTLFAPMSDQMVIYNAAMLFTELAEREGSQADREAAKLLMAKVERDERTPKDERAAFEEWFATLKMAPLDRSAHPDVEYVYTAPRYAWMGWQARAALVAKIVDSVSPEITEDPGK